MLIVKQGNTLQWLDGRARRQGLGIHKSEISLKISAPDYAGDYEIEAALPDGSLLRFSYWGNGKLSTKREAEERLKELRELLGVQ